MAVNFQIQRFPALQQTKRFEDVRTDSIFKINFSGLLWRKNYLLNEALFVVNFNF